MPEVVVSSKYQMEPMSLIVQGHPVTATTYNSVQMKLMKELNNKLL